MKTISNEGLALIKKWEGFRSKAYYCPAGVLTIGYGHTTAAGPPVVTKGMVVTEAEAARILRADVEKTIERVRAVTPGLDKLPQDAFDAVISFAFNVGPGTFFKGGSTAPGARSTVWRGVQAYNRDLIAGGLRMYVKARDPKTGKLVTLKGLVARREDEARMVEMAVWDPKVKPEIEVAPLPPIPDVPKVPEPVPVPVPEAELPKPFNWAAWVALVVFLLMGLAAALVGLG